MARLSGVCAGHKWPASTPNGKQASPCWAVYHVNLLTFGPSMARLLNAARAIFGPPGFFSNERARFPHVSDFPLFPNNYSESVEKFPNFHLSQKFLDFHPPEFLTID